MTYRLIIPRWLPTPLNKFVGYHWRTMHRLKTVDRRMIEGYVLANRFPLAQGPREVSLLITLGPKQRAPDPDAFWKSTLDGLVHARMLIDDNRQYCRLGCVDFERGPERATTITLTDL
jgi:hypothetical protein